MQLNRKIVACSLLVLAANAQADNSIDRMSLADMRQALDKGTISSEQLVRHYLDNIQANNRAQLMEIMKQNKVDSLFFATINCPASVVHGVTDDSYVCKSEDTYASSYIASATGFPEITVPAGTIKGNLPVGVSFLGGYGEDAKVVGFGYAFLGR